MRAADLMTRKVLTVFPRTTVREAAKVLASNGFTTLPVVDDDGVLVGVVTEADVIRDRIPGDPRSRRAGDPYGRRAARAAAPAAPTTVGEVMTAPAVALPPSTDVAELASFMLRTGIRGVPIVDGPDLIGIVTRRDLVRSLARDDVALATDVRRRLELYGGPGRWRVDVHDGRVTIRDERDDPVDAHVAKIIALAVPGVEFARVVDEEPADGPAAEEPNDPGKPGAGPWAPDRQRRDATYAQPSRLGSW